MKRSVDLWLFVAAISIMCFGNGCGLLQKTTKTTSQSSESANSLSSLKTKAETSSTANAKQLKFKQDSVNADYSIQFWPKGALVFLPEGGFSGDFDSVKVQGKLKKISKSAVSLNHQETQNGTLHTDLKAQHHSAAETKQEEKKTFPSWIFIVLGVAVVLIIAIKLRN